jgi:hypothetical protein
MPKEVKVKTSNKNKKDKKDKNKARIKNKIDIRININSKKDKEKDKKDKNNKGSLSSYKSYTQRSSGRGGNSQVYNNKDVMQQPIYQQPNFQNPIIHIQPVAPLQNNSSLLDNQYGLGMTKQINALEGEMTRIKTDRDTVISVLTNEKNEREKFYNTINDRIKELTNPLIYDTNKEPENIETQPKQTRKPRQTKKTKVPSGSSSVSEYIINPDEMNILPTNPTPFSTQITNPMDSNNYNIQSYMYDYKSTPYFIPNKPIPYSINIDNDNDSKYSYKSIPNYLQLKSPSYDDISLLSDENKANDTLINSKQQRELKKISENITDKAKLPAEPKKRGRPPTKIKIVYTPKLKKSGEPKLKSGPKPKQQISPQMQEKINKYEKKK